MRFHSLLKLTEVGTIASVHLPDLLKESQAFLSFPRGSLGGLLEQLVTALVANKRKDRSDFKALRARNLGVGRVWVERIRPTL